MSDVRIKPKISSEAALRDIVSYAVFRLNRFAEKLETPEAHPVSTEDARTAEELLQLAGAILESSERAARGRTDGFELSVRKLRHAFERVSDALTEGAREPDHRWMNGSAGTRPF